MKLFKQLFDEGATFAKEIFDDSAEFVKGVAQACEPYARDAADRLVQAWEDLTNPDAEDAELTAGSSDKGVDSVNLAAENADSTKEAKPADDAKEVINDAGDADSADVDECQDYRDEFDYEPAPELTPEEREKAWADFDAFLDRYLVEHPDCQELADRLRGIERKAETASQSPRVLVDIDIQRLFGLDEEGSEMKPESESESEPEAEAEIESESTSEASPSPKKPLRRYRNVTNITTFDDGVRASENARHAEWLRTSTTLRLDKRDLAAITISMDFHLAMEEPAVYGNNDFFDHCGAGKQKQVYWMLRKKCDKAGIKYNKRDVPYYTSEYTVAIDALRKLLREHGVED